jgi:hypothetical protein
MNRSKVSAATKIQNSCRGFLARADLYAKYEKKVALIQSRFQPIKVAKPS